MGIKIKRYQSSSSSGSHVDESSKDNHNSDSKYTSVSTALEQLNLDESILDEAKALIYLAKKSGNYDSVITSAFNSLDTWRASMDSSAREVLLYYMHISKAVCEAIYSKVLDSVHDFEKLELNSISTHEDLVDYNSSESRDEIKGVNSNSSFECYMLLLRFCTQPASADSSLVKILSKLLVVVKNEHLVELLSHVILNQVPLLDQDEREFPFEIISKLVQDPRKSVVASGLRIWLALLNNCTQSKIENVITQNASQYFDLLKVEIGKASKYALKVLMISFENLKQPISTDTLYYNPEENIYMTSWARYASLIEIIGVDTSLHQMTSSLSDLVSLLEPTSVIPTSWMIALINVGINVANTESIRVYTTELILGLSKESLGGLAKEPEFVANVLYQRFLITSSFVVVNNRCLHAEHLEKFTYNYVKACISENVENLKIFFYEIGKYFAQHAHCFEAPRVLIANAFLNSIDLQCLTDHEIVPMISAMKETKLTYNNKAMADLFYDIMKKTLSNSCSEACRDILKTEFLHCKPSSNSVIDKERIWGTEIPGYQPAVIYNCISGSKLTPTDIEGEEIHKNSEELNSFLDRIWNEVYQLGFLTRQCYNNIALLNSIDATATQPILMFLKSQSTTPTTLIECILPIQKSQWSSVNVEHIRDLLFKELKNPPTLDSQSRILQAYAVEVAFDFLGTTDSYEAVELTFNLFSDMNVRLSALRALSVGGKQMSIDQIDCIWSHIKESGLRIVDRPLHHAFIQFLCQQELNCQNICLEIVEFSSTRKNLLYYLSNELYQKIKRDSENCIQWIYEVFTEIFSFIPSNEYALQLETIVADRFDVYRSSWGPKESEARALAACALNELVASGNTTDKLISYVLEKANLKEPITGSLDNINGHKRVLYYQLLIILIKGAKDESLLSFVVETITLCLDNESNPPCRLHAEWLMSLMILYNYSTSSNSSGLEKQCFAAISTENQALPRVVSSWIRISMLILLCDDEYDLGGFATELVQLLIPCAASNRAVVRHSAVAALFKMSQSNHVPQLYKKLVEGIANLNKQGLQASNYQYDTYLWDVKNVKLGPICGGFLSAHYKYTMPNTLMASDFSEKYSAEVGQCWNAADSCKSAEPKLPDGIKVREDAIAEAVDRTSSSTDFSTHVQTKAASLKVELGVNRTDLIVVATLCDKPVNLGAICRLSDALGAKMLTIKDKNMLKDPNFKSTSLTAEKWLPLSEIGEDELYSFLQTMKTRGYSVIGIEQTDSSKILRPNLMFPSKALLVMGHEKQGIPPEILSLMDGCVEIEQKGYVRSMNIQTATAIVVQAYNNQNSLNYNTLEYK